MSECMKSETTQSLLLFHNLETNVYKRQRIAKGQSKMDNPEKLATQGTQDGEKKTQANKQAKTNNVNKT